MLVVFVFERFEVYRMAVNFSSHVFSITKGFPCEYMFLAEQLRRGAASVATNIAMASKKNKGKRGRGLFATANKYCFECAAVLDLISEKRLIPVDDRNELKEEAEAIVRLINVLIDNS